jgi:ATP-dependent Lon protease
MQPQQPGYNSSRVYLDLLADLPWQKASEEIELDLRAAQKRLDSDHYGLVKVKQRIIEYLAVRKVAKYRFTMPVGIYWIVKFNVFLI